MTPSVTHHSIGTRSAADGPVWSPDGRAIAFQMDQALWVMQVLPDGTPVGKPRKLADGFASFISWTGDSSRLLYVDVDELKLIHVANAQVRKVPLDLTWQRDIPSGRLVIHVGALVDGIREQARSDVDIIVERNRIVAIEPHRADRKADRFIDASSLTVMPGLINAHVHFAKKFGSSPADRGRHNHGAQPREHSRRGNRGARGIGRRSASFAACIHNRL